MANFAKLDKNNIVTTIDVVHNRELLDENLEEQESIGIQYLKNFYDEPNGVWVQCSYNGNFRGKYPCLGWTYDSVKDVFKSPKPFPSWVWSDTESEWKAPVPKPGMERPHVKWDENTISWVDHYLEGEDGYEEWIERKRSGGI